jgi:hypothetical protein
VATKMATIPKVDVLFSDGTCCLVMCSYCNRIHKHSELTTEPVVAHCRKGSYTMGDEITGKELWAAIKRRNYELDMKRKQYAKKKEMKKAATKQNEPAVLPELPNHSDTSAS